MEGLVGERFEFSSDLDTLERDLWVSGLCCRIEVVRIVGQLDEGGDQGVKVVEVGVELGHGVNVVFTGTCVKAVFTTRGSGRINAWIGIHPIARISTT